MKKNENKSGIMEVVFILDRSGSMSGQEADTIGGFNSMLQKQKKESENVIWSTVLFDDRHKVIHNRVPIEKVEPLTEDELLCPRLHSPAGRHRKSRSPYRDVPQVPAGGGCTGEDPVHHHHRRHGERQQRVFLPQSQGNDRVRKRTVRMGIHVPGRQYRRRRRRLAHGNQREQDILLHQRRRGNQQKLRFIQQSHGEDVPYGGLRRRSTWMRSEKISEREARLQEEIRQETGNKEEGIVC